MNQFYKFYSVDTIIYQLRLKLTGAKLIRSSKDYNEKSKKFRVREDILHSRCPFDVPAIYKSENTWETKMNSKIIVENQNFFIIIRYTI